MIQFKKLVAVGITVASIFGTSMIASAQTFHCGRPIYRPIHFVTRTYALPYYVAPVYVEPVVTFAVPVHHHPYRFGWRRW